MVQLQASFLFPVCVCFSQKKKKKTPGKFGSSSTSSLSLSLFFFIFFLYVYEKRYFGVIWFVLNNNFQFLNNIICISIYFFTHIFFHKYFQITIFNF